MRWKYLVPRLVIVAIVWSFFAWAFDPILRWSLTKTGARIHGAKVDVADLKTTFFPPAVELRNVEIADRGKPGRNFVEFETFRLQLGAKPLAHRKLVIEEGRITGLTWNTPRDDSGQLEDDSFRLGEHVPLDELRNRISQLGKTWLKEALGTAKSQLDPEQLETVKVSQDLKDQWLARFQSYETRLKDIEDRVKNLKAGVKPEGNALQKIEAYRLAAIEVQNLLREAQQLRQELSQLGPMAVADLQQIELAKQRDLANVEQKLKILKFDKKDVSEAILGPEIVAALEETLAWVNWTKENIGRLTAVREPERSRGVDVPFAKPEDPHPEFLIQKLLISGTARVKGEMVPYSGTLSNITTDPKRWGKPVVLDIVAEGASRIHLTATIDRTTDQPAYQLQVEYRIPNPAPVRWGDGEKLAFAMSAEETVWKARLTSAGDTIDGQVTFLQKDVKIEPESGSFSDPVRVASIEPVGFEWDPQTELHRALSGVFRDVRELEAKVEVSGPMSRPEWKFSSSLGQKIAAGVESYLAEEMNCRRLQLVGEVERLAGERMASFREILGEKFRASAGRLKLTETEANGLVRKFAGRPLDIQGLFR